LRMHGTMNIKKLQNILFSSMRRQVTGIQPAVQLLSGAKMAGRWIIISI